MEQLLRCNICGTIVDDEAAAKSDICKRCELRVRHRAVYEFLKEAPEVNGALECGRVLFCHMTPNERRYLFSRCRDFINFDVRPMKYLDFTMDIQDMHRISTASVDVFVAVHVVNHVQDDDRAFEEIARVLKRIHGILLLTVPVRSSGGTVKAEDITQHYGESALKEYGVGSYRHYGLTDILQKLEAFFWIRTFEFNDPLVAASEIVFCCYRRG